MTCLSVVVDSCVIYPMPLCDTFLRAAEAELYQVHFSQEILDGATRNLVKNDRMTESKAERFQQILKINFPEAMVEAPNELVENMTNHPGDRHVVASAIIAQAEVIVTSNLKHFPQESLSAYSIKAWHPDIFLVYLYERFPEQMVRVIQQQSEDLKKPPISFSQLIDKLDKNNHVTKFANKIRSTYVQD